MVLPKDYDAHKNYPLLFFLHGAVSSNMGYPDYADARDTSGWNMYYTKYATVNKVIMVYPMGNRDYSWMYPDKGFYMIPAMIKQIKQVINVDDNKVFISGHSNGATGSFSYAIKQPYYLRAFTVLIPAHGWRQAAPISGICSTGRGSMYRSIRITITHRLHTIRSTK
ncbi:hypothetical protein [Mucilaginibacter sp. 5C4]|uniref:hypothetical protein n=1 Tax=Mucilaginibacter sp. 5C4 TaxID=3048589 RepID=UPI002AC9DC65|nr:hypothetical protein [Mucilaginibacter sp. 5C4]MEB0280863.1 hypothetical protein [Mucilaginibacter sp. 10B2]WPX25654.1 hypothetical protein RHM67_10295 [Mucilaginibacter sp. 5C4]